MRTIKAIMENGDYIITRINGSEERIKRYYIGSTYVYEDIKTGKETQTRFVDVEFLDGENA
jgi:hypothetical protein